MNECVIPEMRDLLPELLHDKLSPSDKTRLESHIASCESCGRELSVLRTIKSAAAFEPRIDVNRIVAQIPPYQRIQPSQAPARSRTTSWVVAASFAVVALVAGSLLATRSTPPSTQRVATSGAQRTPPQSTRVTDIAPAARNVPKLAPVLSAPSHAPALAVAADVDRLSDSNLVKLMDEMDHMDGLPASDPEPLFAMDTGDEIGQR